MRTRDVVERFWAALQRNDWQAAGELLHDDYVLEWPQSGERIRGGRASWPSTPTTRPPAAGGSRSS